MAKSYIDFACTQQDLARSDEKKVAEGASVLSARFDLCQKWEGLDVYARFQHMAEVYDVPLVGGAAKIPHEIVKPTGFYVSVFGEDAEGGRLTSARVFVDVEPTISLDGAPPIPASGSLIDNFNSMVHQAASNSATAAASATAASDSANAAATSASNAASSASAAAASAEEAAASVAKLPSAAVVSAIGLEFAIGDTADKISTVTEWATATSTLSTRQRACCYGNGYYIVCGTSGELVYSQDAVNWTEIAPFTSDVITGMTYGKGRFVAIDSGGAMWYADETPANWDKADAVFSVILESVTYANNRFVMTGAAGFVAFSDDGITWQEGSTGQSNDLYGIVYGAGKYVAVGYNGTVVTSFDGAAWTLRNDAAITASFRCVSYGGGLFVLGGQGGMIRYSDDGITWQTATSNSTSTVNYIRAIVYCEGTFYAVMYLSSGKGEIWTSADGASWMVQKSTAGRLWCMAEGDDIIFTSGDNGAVYVLDLGVEWLDHEPTLASGRYLWQRPFVMLSDGGKVNGESVCLKHATPNTEEWTFTLEDGSTVAKAVCIA